MSWFLLTSITFLAVFAFPTNGSVVNDGHKIVGGQDAEIQDYPYQVSVECKGIHYCGGTIVDNRHIVTAAHCFNVCSERYMTVRVNSSFKEKEGKVIKVQKIYSHPKYDGGTKDDIGVIILTEKLKFGDGIRAAKLPPNKENLSGGDYVNITGWGKTQTSNYNGQLQVISVPIVDFKQCQDLYKDFGAQVQKGMICAGLIEGGKGICNTDSGGPLVANGILYGVVSWGDGCAEPERPGVFADVAYYLDFVKEGMAL